ncbi:MAG: hypothetical protein MRJ65_01480 [Candidatus Brocadiaceae bacterium]|nr:hypothetical protein [Candidatus Brocadiaceae bacterium]
MTENLQDLLDRIKKEGVEKAEAEAAAIISKARETSAQIIKEAEARAKELLEKSKQEAKVYTDTSKKVLEQAGRDLLISVSQGIEKLLNNIVFHTVGDALSPEVLMEMMVKLADAYAKEGFSEGRIDMLISPEDQKTLIHFFMEKFREQFEKGIEIHIDNHINKGFKVTMKSDNVFHDFTQESISESICHFLKPRLANIVHRIVHDFNGST